MEMGELTGKQEGIEYVMPGNRKVIISSKFEKNASLAGAASVDSMGPTGMSISMGIESLAEDSFDDAKKYVLLSLAGSPECLRKVSPDTALYSGPLRWSFSTSM